MAGQVDQSFEDFLYQSSYESARKLGVGQCVADDLARMVEESIRRAYGCRRVYIRSEDRSERNQKIFAAYLDGEKPEQIAGRFGLAVVTVYQICQGMRDS